MTMLILEDFKIYIFSHAYSSICMRSLTKTQIAKFVGPQAAIGGHCRAHSHCRPTPMARRRAAGGWPTVWPAVGRRRAAGAPPDVSNVGPSVLADRGSLMWPLSDRRRADQILLSGYADRYP